MEIANSDSDPCRFIRNNPSPVYLAIYVDDGLIVGKDKDESGNVLLELSKSFKLTSQPFERFLGIEFIRTERGIFIDQRKCILDLLKKYYMSECKALDIPMSDGFQLRKAKEADTYFDFQGLIGSLLFLVRCYRLDELSQFTT